MTRELTVAVAPEQILNKILVVKGKRVMLDRDLANLYGVATNDLNQAVRRNKERFPKDFMCTLSYKEAKSLIPQIVVSNSARGGTRKRSLVFTEQGVAMLSSVLNSKRAIQVNIQIMRAFTKLREMLIGHKDLQKKIEEMESKYDQQFRVVFEAIRQLITVESKPKKLIGFTVKECKMDSGSSLE